jgi:hypothetical protein
MKRFCTLILTTMSPLLLRVALPAGDAVGQPEALKEHSLGGVDELADGTVRPVDAVTGAESVHIGNPG